jgi:hypothetical protein
MSQNINTPLIKNDEISIGGKKVGFSYPIAQMLEFPEVIVIRLEVPPDSRFNENVFGIDYDGKTLWQIPPQQHIREDSPYTNINYEQDDKAGCYNWDSTLYIVEPRTGKIIDKHFLK